MTQPQRDELLENIHELERNKRFWKRLTFALGSALLLLLLLAGGSSVAPFLQAAAQRDQALQARREAEVAQQEAMQQRRRAEEQLREAQKAAELAHPKR